MTSRRHLAVFALTALLAGVAGCHRETVRPSAYPPPPDYSSARPHSSGHPAHHSSPAPAGTSPVTLGTTRPPYAPTPQRAPAIARGNPVSTEVGLASWYGPPYNHRRGADGTVYDQDALTAAHRTLPMGSMVRVTNLSTNQSVLVQITDRGPFIQGRIIDLSLAAAKATGLYRMGVAKVKVEAYAPPLGANPDGRWCVQVGAFSTEQDALDLKDQLLDRYADARVIEFAGPTGHWVRINPHTPDKAHATQVAGTIHSPDPAAAPYLIRLD